ncbi:MAG: SMC-Scp complex subunit ScpB [Pirellulales bacterium]
MARFGKPRRTPAEQFAGAGRPKRLPGAKPRPLDQSGRKASSWRRRLDPRKGRQTGAADPWTRDPHAARLEAVLFLAREPLNTRKLAQLAHLADGTLARTLIRRLNRWYDETGSAFAAEELAGGFQLMSRPKFAAWLRRLYRWPVEIRLSGPALETLAVVAYRQPVMRAEIEAIRGVDCGEIVRQLMDRNLVRPAGRAEELGRPYLYATTKRFLEVFGLRHLEDLPRAELLRSPATQPPQPAAQSRAAPSGGDIEIHDQS